jgi:chromosomal replication initiator protein
MMHDILTKTAELFDVTINQLRAPGRCKARVSQARFAAVYAARRLTRYSQTEIGEVLGGRDHTTILNAERQAAALAQADPWFAERLAALL